MSALALVLAIFCGGEAQAKQPQKLPTTKELNQEFVRKVRCVRDTIWTESRGEDEYAQALTGWVLVERTSDGIWGGTTICQAAYAWKWVKVRGTWKKRWQFDGNKNGPLRMRDDDPRLASITSLAIRILRGYWQPKPQHACARVFQRVEHADPGAQPWFDGLDSLGPIGRHTFYCRPGRATTASR